MPAEKSEPAPSTQCRLLIQQCLGADLRVDDTNVLTISRGVVIYVSFFKKATEEVAKKAAQVASQLKLCETESGGFVSAAELPADILLIPQACLAGKRKGNNMQYHQLIDKTLGHQLFEVMKAELGSILQRSPAHETSRPKVLSGIYGQRQVLKIDASMGPYSHVVDL